MELHTYSHQLISPFKGETSSLLRLGETHNCLKGLKAIIAQVLHPLVALVAPAWLPAACLTAETAHARGEQPRVLAATRVFVRVFFRPQCWTVLGRFNLRALYRVTATQTRAF
jgi:hypothetical protein